MDTEATLDLARPASHADVIQTLGNSRLAAALGQSSRTIGAWKFRGSIPGPWFAGVASAAEALGRPDITVQVLAELADARKAEAAE